MAFVLETGAGLTNSTSYSSVAEADAYFADRGTPAAWSAASTAEKEEALVDGAQYIDLKYIFKGSRVNRDQAMEFPRVGVRDRGWVLDSDSIPERLKQANAEAGLLALSEDLLPAIDNPGRIKREKIGAGKGAAVQEVEYEYGASQTKQLQKVDLLVRSLTRGGPGVADVIRT